MNQIEENNWRDLTHCNPS